VLFTRCPSNGEEMSTKVYGASDDLIEFEGDVDGEVGFYSSKEDGSEQCLVMFDDGTMLAVSYGKPTGGIWRIDLLQSGSLFERIDVCNDEDADPHSDVAYFRDGLKKAWAARSWEVVH